MASELNPQFDKFAECVAARIVSALHEARPPIAPEWLSLKQAAAYLGYTTEKAFRDRCSQPEPPPSYKLGRLRRFKRDELDNWVRGQ